MDPQRFDRITRAFGTRFSRRSAMSTSVGLGSLALTSSPIVSANAQDATPAASPVVEGEKTTFLFLQTFDGGSLMPKPGEEGIYVLSLQGDRGRTIGFSDRPERIVTSGPTQGFLDGLGFSPVDPPNAALVFEPSAGETDVIVLELLNPQYDAAAQTLTYDVRILDTFAEQGGLSFQEEPRQPDPAGEEFGPAELYIDDCPNLSTCYNALLQPLFSITGGPYGTCWSWGGSGCQPDNSPCNGPSQAALNQICNSTNPTDCDNACFAGI
jgi:hypothetical protein